MTPQVNWYIACIYAGGEKYSQYCSPVIHMDVFTSLWPPVLRTRCFSPLARCRRCRHPAASGWCSDSSPLRMVSSARPLNLLANTKLPTAQCRSPVKHFPFHSEVLTSVIVLRQVMWCFQKAPVIPVRSAALQ